METTCIFCDGKLEKYLIKKFEYWGVYLCEDQNYLGRIYIVLKKHGPGEVTELKKEEWDELKDVVDKASKVLQSLYKYDFINYLGLQNNDRNHFHIHLVPRYKDIRIINGGEEFKDERWGHSPFPASKKEFSEKILMKIKEDIQKEL